MRNFLNKTMKNCKIIIPIHITYVSYETLEYNNSSKNNESFQRAILGYEGGHMATWILDKADSFRKMGEATCGNL